MSRNDTALLNEVAELLSLTLEGDIPAERFDYFKELLRTNSRAREHYYRLLAMHAALQETENILMLQESSQEALCSRQVWDALSIEEKTAPALALPPQKEVRQIVQKIHYDKEPFRISRFSLVTFVLTTAAVLVIALILHFGPDPSIQVATLSSSIDAVFADAKSYPVGSRLSNHTDSLWLQKGVIKIEFDYGARVVIEAPAQFQLKSAEDMVLYSGRLYAHVPDRSKGFTVETPNSRVIDLGTEFAVRVDFNGTSDVHMLKGSASLIPGTKGQTGQGQILSAGQARHVDAKNSVQEIPLQDKEFVRDFLPDRKSVWRGQSLDLADIVNGGCGLGTGIKGTGIDPLTGKQIEWATGQDRYGQGVYAPVSASPFIDGVFIPDGGNGAMTVSTAGHRYYDCPDTQAFFRYEIVGSPSVIIDPNQYPDDTLLAREEQLMVTAVKKGYASRLMGLYAAKEKPGPDDSSMLLHANVGITFDLQSLRTLLPSEKIVRFTTVFGIAEVCPHPSDVDVTILVDGQLRYSRTDVTHPDSVDIQIDLSETDRFLTLMVTESGDNSWATVNATYDWGLFMNPRLEIE